MSGSIQQISGGATAAKNPYQERFVDFANKIKDLVSEYGEKKPVQLEETYKEFQDIGFLAYLVEKEGNFLVKILNRLTPVLGRERSICEYSILKHVFSQCDFPRFYPRSNGNASLYRIYDCFMDFEINRGQLSPERLSEIGICMAEGYYSPIVDDLLANNIDDLSPACLRAIVNYSYTQQPQWKEKMEKLLPRLAKDPSFDAACCLLEMAAQAAEGGHSPLAERIFNEWDQLTPHPLPGVRGGLGNTCYFLIRDLCPNRLAESLQSSIQLNNWSNVSYFVSRGALDHFSREELGQVLQLAATLQAQIVEPTPSPRNGALLDSWRGFQTREQLLSGIVNHKEAGEIPQKYLRQALTGLSTYIKVNFRVSCKDIQEVCDKILQLIREKNRKEESKNLSH